MVAPSLNDGRGTTTGGFSVFVASPHYATAGSELILEVRDMQSGGIAYEFRARGFLRPRYTAAEEAYQPA